MIAVLLIVSMVVRGLVPTGYMIERSGETGKLMVHICGAAPGAEYVVLDEKTGKWSLTSEPQENSDRTDNSTACEFAISIIGADLAEAPAVIMKAFGLPLLAGRIFFEQHYKRPVRPPLPARGPPTLF